MGKGSGRLAGCSALLVLLLCSPTLAADLVDIAPRQALLQMDSATQISLRPNDGCFMPAKVSGNWRSYCIPSAGVTLSNGGLSATQTYSIYLFDSSGSPALEASTTTSTADATRGVKVKTGDSSRTYLGTCITNGSSQFSSCSPYGSAGSFAGLTGTIAATQNPPSGGGTGANNTATSGRYLKGDGTNFVTSSGSASGTGACSTNNFASTLNSDAAPTCTRPTFANVDPASDLTAGQQVILTGDISPSQLTATTDDWAPTGLSSASTIRVSTDASRNLTGITGGADGRVLILHNVGSFNLVLKNDVTSTAANRFLFGADVTLAANQSVTVQYDATTSRWRAITTPSSGAGGGTVTTFAIDSQRFDTANPTTTPTVTTKAVNAIGALGASPTINWNNGVVQSGTLNANATFTLSNPTNGQMYTLIFTQDATGSRTVTWPGTVLWPGGVTLTVNPAASSVTFVKLYWDGTSYYGWMSGGSHVATSYQAIGSGGGQFDFTSGTAPSSPASGHVVLYSDSTNDVISQKDNSGNVKVMVKPDAGASDNFLTAVSAGGVPSKAQPAFSNLSGIATPAQLSQTVNAQIGTTYTVSDGDRGKLVTHTNGSAIAVTLPQAGASSLFISGWFMDVQNRGAGTVTITPTTSTIDSASNLALTTNQGVRIFSDGTNYFTQRGVGAASSFTASSTDTLTGKTYDTEGTGNVFSYPVKVWLPAAGCDNATASSSWDLPTSAAAAAACVTGTNIQKGVLDFADSGPFSAQITLALQDDWTTTGGVDAKIYWTTSATTGNAKWSFSTACTAVDASATDDPTFNTANTVTTAAPGTANRVQTSSITGVTMTGCTTATPMLLHLKILRDGTDGSDTIGATARLIGIQLTVRRAI